MSQEMSRIKKLFALGFDLWVGGGLENRYPDIVSTPKKTNKESDRSLVERRSSIDVYEAPKEIGEGRPHEPCAW